MVALTLPRFFVRTPEDFLEFTRARKPDPETGQPDMAKIGAFLEAHPEALPAIQHALSQPAPASYAQSSTTGSTRLADRRGRYGELDPLQPSGPPPARAGLRRGGARGRRELSPGGDPRAPRAGPVEFALEVSIAEDGDDPDDPTEPWPDERERGPSGR